MNSTKNGTSTAIRFALFFFLLLGSGIAWADDLNMYISTTRFMDDTGNTTFEIVYKIPYGQLKFQQLEDRFEANVNVAVIFEQGEKRRQWQQFKNPVVTRDLQKTKSSGEYYLDKISLTLSKEMLVELNFIDVGSGKTAQYRKELKLLEPGTLLSDLEFSSQVLVDPDHRFVKFSRGDSLFFVSPDRIYNLQNYASMYLYYEVINLKCSDTGIAQYEETVTVSRNNEVAYRTKVTEDCVGSRRSTLKRIDLTEFASGKYDVEVTVRDIVSGKETTRTGIAIVRARENTRFRFFPDINDEFLLIKTFLPVAEYKVWDELSDAARDNYLDTFWRANDPNPDTPENEFYEIVQDRVSYSNEHFSRFEDGWKTDRGRIYIRNGAPVESTTDFTDPSQTRFASKEYLIWKYNQPEHRVYLFIDQMMNGDFKLVYVDNDDNEQTLPTWKRYFGDEFDETLLE